jgi:hypothetical protein
MKLANLYCLLYLFILAGNFRLGFCQNQNTLQPLPNWVNQIRNRSLIQHFNPSVAYSEAGKQSPLENYIPPRTLAGTARVQVIHASPDTNLGSADPRRNKAVKIRVGSSEISLKYRTATPFIDINVSDTITVIAPDNSVLTAIPPNTLEENKAYVVVAHGMKTPGAITNPDGKDISFKVTAFEWDTTAEASGSRLKFLNCVPDLPAITYGQFRSTGADFTRDGLQYGDTSAFTGLPVGTGTEPIRVALDITHKSNIDSIINQTIIDIPASMAGQSYFGFIVGLEKHFANVPGDAPYAFLVRKNGQVDTLQPHAYVQFMNNSPDPALNTGEFYIGGGVNSPLFNNLRFEYRAATIFVPIELGISDNGLTAPLFFRRTATNATAAVNVPFNTRKDAFVCAQGMVDPNDYAPNPDGQDIFATLFVTNNIRPASARIGESYNDELEVRFLHGVSDAGRVALNVDGSDLAPGVRFNQMTLQYATFPLTTTEIIVTNGGTVNLFKHATNFEAVTDPTNRRAFMLATGYLNPQANRNGHKYALLVTYSGSLNDPQSIFATVDSFPVVENYTGISTKKLSNELQISYGPNPVTDYLTIESNASISGTYELVDIAGKIVATGKVENNTVIPVHQLPKGMYVLKVQANNQAFTAKISLQ